MRELTINSSKANLYGLLFAIVFAPIMSLAFYYLWHDSINLLEEIQHLKRNLLWIFVIVLLAMVLHESLHALAWLALTKGDYKNISFGLIWRNLTPYCHYSKVVTIIQYRIALITPGILTGIIPFIIALSLGSFPILFFALLFTFGAVGDFIILWLIRHEKPSALVQDHPDKIGCQMIDS